MAVGPAVKPLPDVEKFLDGAEGNVCRLDGLLNWVPSRPVLLNELAEELIPAFCLGWLNDARNGEVFGGKPVAGVGVEGVPSVVVAGTVAGVVAEGVPVVAVVAGVVGGGVQPCCAITKLAELAHRQTTMTDNAAAKRSVG